MSFARRAWETFWRGDARAPAHNPYAVILGTLGACLGAWLGDRWWLRKHGPAEPSR